MRLPNSSDYHQAIQNPGIVLQEPELKKCQVKTDPMGMPVVSSGGFALTYCLIAPNGNRWAVRCFHRHVPDRQRRYEEISRFLQNHPNPIFTRVSYINDGILVNGQKYPIIKMPWIEGQTLSKFIESNITGNRLAINHLPGQFKQLVETLEGMGVAHGDLQHGNIMVNQGKLVLVDYDGLYVPALKNYSSAEFGHVNYQHPARQNEFDPLLDRFSSIVIYLALNALVKNSNLWQKYSTGENLLFKQEDFRSPDTSPLLHELEKISDLTSWVRNFRVLCQYDLNRIPRLVDFLQGQVPTGTVKVSAPTAYRSQYRVIAATDRRTLLANIGERVTVVGCITNYRNRRKSNDLPDVFLNFGDWKTGCLTLVIWSETLQLFAAQRKNPTNYKNKWVSVTGLLVEYPSRGTIKRPQIVIEMPSEIEILYGDEPEAQQRLQAQGGNATVLSKGPSAPSSYKDSTASSISDLYKDWPAGSKPTKPQSRKPVPPSKAPPSTTKKPSSASLFQPRLNVPTKVIDFGKIQAGQEQSQFLEVTNTGSGPLHVMVNTAVQWLTVTPMQLICVAGETKRITVSFKNNFNPDQLFDLIRKDASELSASKKQANPTVNEFVIPSAITLVSIGGSESIGVSVKLPSSPALAPAPASIKQMWIDFSKGLKQILKK